MSKTKKVTVSMTEETKQKALLCVCKFYGNEKLCSRTTSKPI
jgi:hypothetical protein